MIKNLGVQLYTVRDLMKDADYADVTFRKLAELGYTEVQTAGCPFDEKKFYELLQKYGISIVGTHYDWKKILQNPEETMEIHRMWNTNNIGVGGMPHPARNNLEMVKDFIRDFNKAAEVYAKEGFRLTYHNHNFEFARIDGYKTIMDMLYEQLDPATTSFVLDACWVSAGGGDVVEWMEKLEGRLDIFHLKDMTVKFEDGKYLPYITEVGYGNLAWDPIIRTAEKIGVKYYVVEQDTNFKGGSPIESLRMSAEFLAKYR